MSLSDCKPGQQSTECNSVDFYGMLKSLQKSSIRVHYAENFTGECATGSSKIGGKPDLPVGFQWYYYHGKSDARFNSALPLSFLAQINLEEASEYDRDKLLPPKGMLYFFYELDTKTWGFIGDKGSARVYYYSGNVSELRRMGFPSDLNDEFKIPEMPITFSNKMEIPDYEEFLEWRKEYPEEDVTDYTRYFDLYAEARAKAGIESEYYTGEEARINKLLGYADLVQSGMLLQCEAATKGVELYSDWGGYSEKLSKDRLRQLKEGCTKWRLLFQLESILTEDYEMLWGDAGRIYYYINIDDLNKRNFDNCWLILQCG